MTKEEYIIGLGKHVASVINESTALTNRIIEKVQSHDRSKFDEPELSGYVIIADKRPEFGTPEYDRMRDEQKALFEHHYKNNSHHPEHYAAGVAGMNLVDICEMFADWKASAKKEGRNIAESFRMAAETHGIPEVILNIFINTLTTDEKIDNSVIGGSFEFNYNK